MTEFRRVLTVSMFIGSFLLGRARSEDWPQFRGQNGAGVSQSTSLPTEFSLDSNVVWQSALGEGVACPIIVADRVYNTALNGEGTFTVFCHEAATGKEQWKEEIATGKLPRITPPNSHASSTPACDGKRVYVYFSTIGLIAFDAMTGQEVWRHALPKPAYLMDWGAACSPIVYRNSVFLAMDDDLSPYVLAVNAENGEQKWRTPRVDMLAGYALPVLCTTEGRTDLVVAGTGKLKGYDPETGAEIWTCNTLLRTIMTSPVVQDGIIYIAVQSYGDSTRTVKFALLEWLDTNQDKLLEKKETPREFWQRFDLSDRNRDQQLDENELDKAFQHPDNMAGGGNIIQAVRGGGRGDVTRTHVKWNLNSKAPSNLSSPLVANKRLYVVKAGGLASCFDIAKGDVLWERKRIQNFGDYYASPIAADGKVFIAGRNGFIVVLRDAPEFEVLSKNDLGEEIVATPAIADGRIFVRTRTKIFCIASRTP